jgi:membrane protein implicated in regulation of membrane protease activity
MPEAVPTILALVIVVVFAVALWLMAAGRLSLAGLSFLSASILIYLRERWRRRNAATSAGSRS